MKINRTYCTKCWNMYLSMAKLMGGSFCSNDFKAIKRQLRSVFTSTFSLDDPTPREPVMNGVDYNYN